MEVFQLGFQPAGEIFDAAIFGVPVISPDGSTIVFVNGERANEVWSMGAEGEAPHKLMELDPRDFTDSLSWSPDGRRIAYVRLRGTYDKHESVPKGLLALAC